MLKKILCVDNSHVTQALIWFTLKNSGYRITQAHNTHQALQMLEQEPHHLLLGSLQAPGMPMPSLIKHMRQSETLKNIPSLVMSVVIDPQLKQTCKKAGASGWLLKPIDPLKLQRALHQLLG